MAKLPNLKHYQLARDFAKSLDVSPELVSKWKRTGTIPENAFTMSGRDLYVKVAAAKAALKSAPIGARGAVPKWVEAVGNKAGIDKLKAQNAKSSKTVAAKPSVKARSNKVSEVASAA